MTNFSGKNLVPPQIGLSSYAHGLELGLDLKRGGGVFLKSHIFELVEVAFCKRSQIFTVLKLSFAKTQKA